MKYKIIGFAFFMLTIGCKKNSLPYNPVNVTTEVRNTLEAYHKAMAEEGLLSEFRYLDSSDHFYWVPPGYETALSYDSVKSILIKNAPTLTSMNGQWVYLDVYPLNDTFANYTGKLHMISQDTSGNRFESDLLETGMMVKRWDGWKLLSGQSRVVE